MSGNGNQYLHHLEELHKKARHKSNETLKPYVDNLKTIGISLEALAAVATCDGGCQGGAHLYQYLAGRCYNIGCATFSLIRLGYYDESLGLIRSLGEIANLLALFLCSNEDETKWRDSDTKGRVKNYGPAAVRKKIFDLKGILLMDAETYSSLCEIATHVTPQTHPSDYSSDKRARVGPHQQSDGAETTTAHLAHILSPLALGFSKFAQNDELFEQLANELAT